jgi:hypothetical protein
MVGMKVRFSWGTGMAVTYTAFVLATGAFVVFAMGRPVALVSDDYYAQSLRQDARMQAVENARALGSAVSVRNAGGRLLIVSLPASQAGSARGTVVLYRAADPAADRVVDLALDGAGRQSVSLGGMSAGNWIVKVRWRAAGREYYYEQPVVAQ